MATCVVARRLHFNAAHRLHNSARSDRWNQDTFGPCNNPNYHGHNYELDLLVEGTIDPDTGYVLDVGVLKRIAEETVLAERGLVKVERGLQPEIAVLAEPEDVEVNLKQDDYRFDTFCASGPGGQHVNKTASAVRLTHFETGIVVQCQDEKSQLKNKTKALRELAARIYDFKKQQEDAKRAAERKTLVGSGDRSERIRTYNFPQNRLTDHRIGLTVYNLDQVVAGNLQPVIDALVDYDRQQLRDQMGGLD